MERLLDYFEPKNYQLTLNINKQTERIRGKVLIIGTPKSNTIKLHAKNLKISSVTIDDEKVPFVYEDEIVEIDLKSPFEEPVSQRGEREATEPRNDGREGEFRKRKTQVNLNIAFSLDINRNMEGAYLSTYRHNGKEQKLVTTQFESHYARQCFPCIDEPEAKATFDLKIISHDPDDTIISNMPAKREEIREVPTFNLEAETLDTKNTNKQKIVEFETTPRMSTYLLAFCVGHFQKKSTKTKNGIEITTYSALNQSKDLLDFPNQIAKEALDYYDDLFGIPYPLPKLDQIAIPDFESGAMENWGLVTYRESCLLAGPKTSQSTKEYIATVITHELSHQWFGNLVTMKWWDDLWLNESFASVMQYLSVNDLHPDWHIMEDFFTGDCYVALKRDSLPGVQAVKQPVNNPEEIATLFDGAIVYAKGAHLIFMLMRLMDRDKFFKGIKAYFKQHKYGNTTGDDLWAALQPHADFDVKDFMHAWISQSGYPVITPKSHSKDLSEKLSESEFTQKRFLITGETDKTTWPLPEITDDMSGHYLINLSDSQFDAKITNFTKLDLEQRLRLLIDRELLSKTPLVSSASLLELLPNFKDETSEPIWSIISTILIGLKIFAHPDTKYYQPYQKYVLDVISSQLTRLGFKPKKSEDQNDTKLRQIVLGFALYAEDSDTISVLSELYNDNYSEINPEIRSDVIMAKFKQTDEKIFSQLLEDYQTASDPSIRAMLLGTITDAKKPEHTKRLLKLLEEPEIVRPQDHIYLFVDLLTNHKTSKAAYDWLYSHWDYIRELAGEKTLDDYLRVSAARIRDDEEAKRFFTFFDQKSSDPALARSIAVAHSDIAARLNWLATDAPAVHAYLASRN